METSNNENLSQEKRIIASRGVYVQIAELKADHSYYNVIDPDTKKVKYIGRISEANDHDQYCTCPDNFHRNTADYRNTHPNGFQCKHQIAYREYLKKFREQCKELDKEDSDYQPFAEEKGIEN